MTLGAFAGVCIVRYSPLSLTANLSLAFVLAGLSLLCSRTTLIAAHISLYAAGITTYGNMDLSDFGILLIAYTGLGTTHPGAIRHTPTNRTQSFG